MDTATSTPEGEPNRCQVCGHLVRLEPSRPPGDAPCPNCGCLLWFPAPDAMSPGEAIRKWVDAVAELPKQQHVPSLLSALSKAFGARACTWWITVDNEWRPGKRVGAEGIESLDIPSYEKRSRTVLQQIVRDGAPSVSRSREDHILSTDYVLVGLPIKTEGEMRAVIEIMLPPRNWPTIHERYWRWLEQACEAVGEHPGFQLGP